MPRGVLRIVVIAQEPVVGGGRVLFDGSLPGAADATRGDHAQEDQRDSQAVGADSVGCAGSWRSSPLGADQDDATVAGSAGSGDPLEMARGAGPELPIADTIERPSSPIRVHFEPYQVKGGRSMRMPRVETPVILEVAINGMTSKAKNPNAPRTPERSSARRSAASPSARASSTPTTATSASPARSRRRRLPRRLATDPEAAARRPLVSDADHRQGHGRQARSHRADRAGECPCRCARSIRARPTSERPARAGSRSAASMPCRTTTCALPSSSASDSRWGRRSASTSRMRCARRSPGNARAGCPPGRW